MAARSIPRWIPVTIGVTALVLATEVARHDPDDLATPAAVNPAILLNTTDDEEGGMPASLVIEHGDLAAALTAATNLGGTTGMAALRVEELMRDHFRSEDEFAIPPLALLRPLAEGRTITAAAPVAIAMGERLKADWPRLLQEHKAIHEALGVLAVEARAEKHPEVLLFVERLKQHALQEEEILYPAAILVGEYLKVSGSKR
jgi:hypothetical protein